ncbi:hypothetical protein, partial [Rodentibacter caecimuris]|uniref:hypothetical protein n=1 Tax=Rodentibacter caecimuris TaxID=1796644 RepID=UPI001959A9FA
SNEQRATRVISLSFSTPKRSGGFPFTKNSRLSGLVSRILNLEFFVFFSFQKIQASLAFGMVYQPRSRAVAILFFLNRFGWTLPH